MKFTLLGGDLRSVYLAERLVQDGHTVCCYGLEQSKLHSSHHCGTITEALTDTQCILLPTPAFVGEQLNAPFSGEQISISQLSPLLPRHVPIYGGSITEELLSQWAAMGIYATDLLGIEALAVKNAALTAECTIQVMLRELPYALAGQPVLILGAGRIGKLLGLKLQAMGARVTVFARKQVDRAWCEAFGFHAVDLHRLAAILPHAHLVVNTIPARILSNEHLRLIPKTALLFELASKPGGFHPLQEVPRVISCSGLPGKYAPKSAADAIAETIYLRLTNIIPTRF